MSSPMHVHDELDSSQPLISPEDSVQSSYQQRWQPSSSSGTSYNIGSLPPNAPAVPVPVPAVTGKPRLGLGAVSGLTRTFHTSTGTTSSNNNPLSLIHTENSTRNNSNNSSSDEFTTTIRGGIPTSPVAGSSSFSSTANATTAKSTNKTLRTGRQRKKQSARSAGGEFNTKKKRRRVYFCCIAKEIPFEPLRAREQELYSRFGLRMRGYQDALYLYTEGYSSPLLEEDSSSHNNHYTSAGTGSEYTPPLASMPTSTETTQDWISPQLLDIDASSDMAHITIHPTFSPVTSLSPTISVSNPAIKSAAFATDSSNLNDDHANNQTTNNYDKTAGFLLTNPFLNNPKNSGANDDDDDNDESRSIRYVEEEEMGVLSPPPGVMLMDEPNAKLPALEPPDIIELERQRLRSLRNADAAETQQIPLTHAVPRALAPPMGSFAHMWAHRTREIFVFNFGAVVFWGFPEDSQDPDMLLEVIRELIAEASNFELELGDSEASDFKLLSDEQFEASKDDLACGPAQYFPQSDAALASSPGILLAASSSVESTTSDPPISISIANDYIALPPDASIKDRLSVSFAVAQSSVLSVFEQRIDLHVTAFRHIPETLASHGKVHLPKDNNIGHMIGDVYALRHDLNLNSEILDTPDYFWISNSEDAALEIYRMTMKYLEMDTRTEVLNNRLNILKELLEVLLQQHEARHQVALEWIIIWLIVISVVIDLAMLMAKHII